MGVWYVALLVPKSFSNFGFGWWLLVVCIDFGEFNGDFVLLDYCFGLMLQTLVEDAS